jgi:hypothetical protein
MAGGIFISYRREDSRHAAGRLVDRLAHRLPREQLFMDVDAIEPGLDFHRVIDAKLSECDVLLAVIGPHWADSRDATGARRLDNPDDYVRLEIGAALQRDIRVIPVLVDGAPVPNRDSLPEPLKPLTRRNAVRLDHERFGAEADELARRLSGLVGTAHAGSASTGDTPEALPRPAATIEATERDVQRRRIIGRIMWAGAVFLGADAIAIAIALFTDQTSIAARDWFAFFAFLGAFAFVALTVYLAKLGRLGR